ncbi:Amine oxidase [Artemisia annua]|uniref:Amine oxidase n=1 Tax=Artemisia annua TaxID=35608 RepID=A0A2U1QNQ5_ARTAN|nr:Amine oxidase [Artemisia annua]
MSNSPCESKEKNCHSGTLPNSLSYTQVEDSVDQKNPTLCIQCDDPEARKKLIVIGAGPAGLTAAQHLQRQGFHVTMLEGRDRIGVRVFTCRSSLSVPLDLGTSIITATADESDQRGWCFMFWNVKKTVNAPVLMALVVGKAGISGREICEWQFEYGHGLRIKLLSYLVQKIGDLLNLSVVRWEDITKYEKNRMWLVKVIVEVLGD